MARKQPNAKMGFLRMADDGTTTLNILNPDNTGYINDKERVITLGEKVGRLKAGQSLTVCCLIFIILLNGSCPLSIGFT